MKKNFAALLLTFGLNNTAIAEELITFTELSKHNSETDCWMAINGFVYNLSKYIKLHNDECKRTKFVEYCGKDASVVWKNKEAEKKPHKKKSIRKLESAKIGKLIAK